MRNLSLWLYNQTRTPANQRLGLDQNLWMAIRGVRIPNTSEFEGPTAPTCATAAAPQATVSPARTSPSLHRLGLWLCPSGYNSCMENKHPFMALSRCFLPNRYQRHLLYYVQQTSPVWSSPNLDSSRARSVVVPFCLWHLILGQLHLFDFTASLNFLSVRLLRRKAQLRHTRVGSPIETGTVKLCIVSLDLWYTCA